MKRTLIAALVLSTMASSAASIALEPKQSRARNAGPEMYITNCAVDGVFAISRDAPDQTLVTEIEDTSLRTTV